MRLIAYLTAHVHIKNISYGKLPTNKVVLKALMFCQVKRQTFSGSSSLNVGIYGLLVCLMLIKLLIGLSKQHVI